MRILGLDIGTKRIGAAVSDALRMTAQGLETIGRNDAAALEGVVKENDISEIVVGLPLNMDGTKGERARDAESFAAALREKFPVPVRLWDERLSTASAESYMIRGGLSRAKRRRLNDRAAAQIILQGYLDATAHR